MIQCQLKLRMTKAQERECERWLYHLASVWNFAIRKIELNAKDGIYFSSFEFHKLLDGHSKKLGIPSHVLRGVLATAFEAWQRCFKKIAGKPRLKGARNRMSSIPFPDTIRAPQGNRITVLGLGSIRFHKMQLPEGRIKCGRICKRASGWYLCLFIDAQPKAIPASAQVQSALILASVICLRSQRAKSLSIPVNWRFSPSVSPRRNVGEIAN